MSKKIKRKLSSVKSVHKQISRKLSYKDRQIYCGSTKKIVYGIDVLQTRITQQALKIFYVYIELKLQEKNQINRDLQSLYTFIDKCIFESSEYVEYIKKSDINELKQLFEKYYYEFIEDTVNNSTLVEKLRKETNSTNIDCIGSAEYRKSIIQRVHDYIDFIDLYYVSKILIQDNLIVPLINKYSHETFPRDINKKTNKAVLDRTIKDRVREEKMSLFHQTMIIIKKDLELYLSDDKYEYVKTLVLDRYNEYYVALLEKIRLKDNFAPKIRSQESFFKMMDKQKMNWVYNYTESNGGSDKSFYVFIYEMVMLKYRLLAYLLCNEYKKKSEEEILKLLDEGAPYPKDDKVFDLFSIHIQSEGDINAYIIKFFEKKYQKFIKILLAIETRTRYEKKEINPLFYSLEDIPFKYNPILALRYFPVKKTPKARLLKRRFHARIKSNMARLFKKSMHEGKKSDIRLKYKKYIERKNL